MQALARSSDPAVVRFFQGPRGARRRHRCEWKDQLRADRTLRAAADADVHRRHFVAECRGHLAGSTRSIWST